MLGIAFSFKELQIILHLLLAIISVLRSVFTENGVKKNGLFVMNVSWLCILAERN